MKFTIITINYNNCDGLEKTIQSVVNQTYQDFEYIIIDGGSIDGSVDVIKKYAGRIDYWVSEPDNGVYNAMNKGITKSHGEYLNFMNSGDSFYDNEVLEKIASMKINADFIGGKTFDNNTKSYEDLENGDFFELHLIKGTLCHQSTFTKGNLLRGCGYREDLKIVSDWAFILKKVLIEGNSLCYIDVVVSVIDGTGISSDHRPTWSERDKVKQEYRLKYPTFRYIDEYNDNRVFVASKLFEYAKKIHQGNKCVYKIACGLLFLIVWVMGCWDKIRSRVRRGF